MQAGGETIILVRADIAEEERVESLAERASSGDREAMEELIAAWQDPVLRLAGRLLGPGEDARDAAQEALFRLCRYISRFDRSRRLSPWIYQITVNVCRDISRRKASQALVSLEEQIENRTLTEPASEADLERDSLAAEQKRILEKALESLPEKERAAIVLRDLEGLSTTEVAAILGSSETTVRSQISSARVKIKKFRDRLMGRKR